MDRRVLTRVRTAVTLVTLLAVVGAAVVWGWSSLTEPLPGAVNADCTEISLERGDKVYPDQVIVSVLNAGSRSGLASRTMSSLTERGFARGDLANAPGGTQVRGVQIWTDDPNSPAVRLLRFHLGRNRTEVVRRDTSSAGISVVVGNRFDDLRRGRKRVVVGEPTTLCSPVDSPTESA